MWGSMTDDYNFKWYMYCMERAKPKGVLKQEQNAQI